MTESAGLSSIEAYDDLREAVGEPIPSIAEKEMPLLDKHARHFLSLSPILFISTVGVDGRADISPRGDPAGFVKVIDDRTILIPERPGNRRVDTMSNIVENPGHSVALIFLLPGVEETLRASGRARIVDDPVALEDMAVRGKVPQLGILVEIDEVFFHCAKALKRARLWDPDTRIDRKEFPTLAQITRDQRESGTPLEEIEERIRESYEKRLY